MIRVAALPALFLLALISFLSVTHAYSDLDNPNLRQLNSENFDQLTKEKAWLVEFFSPQCPHCQAFAPTWKDLSVISEHLEDSSHFFMARVDCIAQGDLCEAQGIQGYPQMNLYKDGKKAETYHGSRGFKTLRAYINQQAEAYRLEKATPPAAAAEPKGL